jgi:hypothetical protein
VPNRFDIEEARQAKAARASALEDLREGSLKPADCLRKPPDALKKTDIWEILLASKHLGKEGARTILERARVWPHTRLGDLTRTEKYAIIKELPERVL